MTDGNQFKKKLYMGKLFVKKIQMEIIQNKICTWQKLLEKKL